MDDLLLLFRECGWKWEDAVLLEVVSMLKSQSVVDRTSFVGLDISDVVGAERWPPGVSDFVAKIGTWQEKGPRRAPAFQRPLDLPKISHVAQPSFAGLARDLFTDLPTQITNFAGAGPRAASQELKRQVRTNSLTFCNVGRISCA